MRTAAASASEPVFTKRAISAHGMTSVRRSATSTSSGCGSEKMLPSATWRATASVIAGYA